MEKRKKVLIVEDERLTAKSLKLDLEDMNLDVLEPVANGEEAVQVALEQNPDLIFMDIRLAGKLDGIEAAKRICEKKHISIVFMTGYSTEAFRKRAECLRPVDFLDKPISVFQLSKLVMAI